MKKPSAPHPRKPHSARQSQPRKRVSGAFDNLKIPSPKRKADASRGWNGFFPYYAGFLEAFARSVLESAKLPTGAIVFDPWNGSGTTTFAASQLSLASQGMDLNPVMLIVARARLLPRSEADSLGPLAREIVKGLRGNKRVVAKDDPLLNWFTLPTVALIRALERRIREHFVGQMTLSDTGLRLQNLSGLAATFYVALFSVCRHLAVPYQSSNPTWLRKPRDDENVIESNRAAMFSMFISNLKSMAEALTARSVTDGETADVKLVVGDTVSAEMIEGSVDFVLTSPPYCTRIDYAAATRIELAVLHPLLNLSMEDLGRQMIGSTRVPTKMTAHDKQWGPTCNRFLAAVRKHPSKASAGYYLKTHVDYFDKMYDSLHNLSAALKDGGKAVLVVQDSHYKDVRNDLAAIVTEMGKSKNLRLGRRVDFQVAHSMANVNPHSRNYRKTSGAVESVLCFQKR